MRTWKRMEKRPTSDLEKVLKSTHPDDIDSYFEKEEPSFYTGNSFRDYIKDSIKGKKTLHEVFYEADVNEGYGYKIISGEKHTNKRDIIIRICAAANLCFEETQTALKLYGMSPLYAKIKRDALLISAINEKLSISQINRILEKNGFNCLEECGSN